MHWVTRGHIHLDRVACPWLIARFIDGEATFGWLSPNDPVPPEATPFALPGADLGPHDATGSCFRKILTRFGVTGPELGAMALAVETGIAVALGKALPDAPAEVVLHGRSMASFSESMAVLNDGDDDANLAASVPYYDAVYVSLWSVFGDAPALPADLLGRIEAQRAARDWSSVLPPWRARPLRFTSPTTTGEGSR